MHSQALGVTAVTEVTATIPLTTATTDVVQVKKTPNMGLVNNGLSCWMNASVQLLLATTLPIFLTG